MDEVVRLRSYAGESDARELVDTAFATVLQEAEWELRQVLTHLRSRLELAVHRGEGEERALTLAEAQQLLENVDRAQQILDVGLDRNETAKRMIPLEMEAFDLSQLLIDWLQREDLFPSERVELTVEPTPVRGDRVKLPKALGSLVQQFHARGAPEQGVVVELAWQDTSVVGFIGVLDAPFGAHELLEDMGRSVAVGELRFDLPLVRAILDRHQGVLSVEERPQDTVGLALELPALDREWI